MVEPKPARRTNTSEGTIQVSKPWKSSIDDHLMTTTTNVWLIEWGADIKQTVTIGQLLWTFELHVDTFNSTEYLCCAWTQKKGQLVRLGRGSPHLEIQRRFSAVKDNPFPGP